MNVKRGSFSIAKYLIEKGANVWLPDEYGATPLEFAVRVWFFILIFALFSALTFNVSFLSSRMQKLLKLLVCYYCMVQIHWMAKQESMLLIEAQDTKLSRILKIQFAIIQIARH